MSIDRSCLFLSAFLISAVFAFANDGSDFVLPTLSQDETIQQEQTQAENQQPNPEDNATVPTLLPDGISEEEARWANWSDWNKVEVKPQDGKTVKKQDFIAPTTKEDAVVDESRTTESVTPQFNAQLDVTNQTLNIDPEEGNTSPIAGEMSNEKMSQDTDSIQMLSEQEPMTNAIPGLETPSAVHVIDSDVRSMVDSATANSKEELKPTLQLVVRDKQQTASVTPETTPRIDLLLERIRTIRRQYFDKTLNTEQNSPFEAMMSANAFGCFVSLEHRASQTKINTIGALCWNYPLCETSLLGLNFNPNLTSIDSPNLTARYPRGRVVQTSYQTTARITPYIGYCQQERAGEFLSILALSHVPIDYTFNPRSQVDIDRLIDAQDKADNQVSAESLSNSQETVTFSVVDLVRNSMDNCSGGDLSALLVALSYYVPREQWTNRWGESWSVLKIVSNELEREANPADSDSTDRLYGLTFALRRRLAFDDNQWESLYVIVDDYLYRMRDYALSIQNADGSWNGAFFTRTGKSRDPNADFAATAHFARWLTIQFQNKALADERLTKAIEYLVTELDSRLKDFKPSEMSQKDVRAIAYALQAIGIYEQRWTAGKENKTK